VRGIPGYRIRPGVFSSGSIEIGMKNNIVIAVLLCAVACINNPVEKNSPLKLTYHAEGWLPIFTLYVKGGADSLKYTYWDTLAKLHRDTMIDLKLSQKDIDSVERLVTKSNIMEYPDTFRVVTQCLVDPAPTYLATVEIHGTLKKVYWNSCDYCGRGQNDSSAIRLKAFFNALDSMVINSDEFKKLPKDNSIIVH